MSQQKLLVTVGIPTYEAGESLLQTIDSVTSQTAYDQIQKVLVLVDGGVINNKISEELQSNKKIQIILKKPRSGQSGSINELCKITKTPLLILTNDDVLLDKHAVDEIIKIHESSNADLITTSAVSLPPKKLLQNILAVGVEITNKIIPLWADTHNYLSCNGRLIALSPKQYGILKIPVTLWNNDAYIYFFSKQQKLKHEHAFGAIVFYQLPSKLKEYISQTKKFAFSASEIKNELSVSEIEYSIPKSATIAALMTVFTTTPVQTILYLILKILVGFMPETRKPNVGYWETDKSTKKITQ